MTTSSGMGSVTRSPLGVWRSLPETRKMAEHALGEMMAVAKGKGAELSENAIPMVMGMFDSLPAGITTSMQRDMMQGRPSELDALSGAVVRFGNETDVETPLNGFMYYALLPLELRARGQLQFPD